MKRMTIRHQADEHERFGPEAADSMIGNDISLSFEFAGESVPGGTGTVVDARVVEDGLAVEMTIEVPDSFAAVVEPVPGSVGGFSIGPFNDVDGVYRRVRSNWERYAQGGPSLSNDEIARALLRRDGL